MQRSGKIEKVLVFSYSLRIFFIFLGGYLMACLV